MGSEGAWEAVEEWLRDQSDSQLLAAPVRSFNVPGAVPMLVLAVIGWRESLSLIYLVPPGGREDRMWQLRLQDDQNRPHPFAGEVLMGEADSGLVIANFWEAIQLDVMALHLSGVPKHQRLTDNPLAAVSDFAVIPLG